MTSIRYCHQKEFSKRQLVKWKNEPHSQRAGALNASFIPKTLHLNSRSPSLMVEVNLVSKLSSILVYI